MNKKNLITTLMVVFITMIIYDGLNQNVSSTNTGAGYGYADDPAYGFSTCTGCHFGPTAAVDTGIISSTIPAAGYKPDTTYTITATVTRAGHSRFGFEITAENPSHTYLGTIINTNSNTQLCSGNSHYITHTLAGTTGTTGDHTWTFNWKAPAVGSGPVTFYGSFNITNNNNLETGDTIVVSSVVIPENTIHAGIPTITGSENVMTIYPNPCKDNTTISMPVMINQSPTVFIYDITGKEIAVPFIVNKGTNLILNTSNFTNGIYFCKIANGEEIIFSGKIVVSK